MAQVEAERVAFRNKRKPENRGIGASVSGSADIVPDWLEGEMLKQRERECEVRDEEATPERVEEMMRRLGIGV